MKSIFLAIFFCASLSNAQFEIFLKESNKIPLYAQETSYWCGAAAAQMMLEGFPEDINYIHPQKFIWETIQHNVEETGWYTDPDGLKKTLEQLGGDSRWEIQCSNTSNSLMHHLAKNMGTKKSPISVLVYGFAHWVVLVGISSDVDPQSSPTIELKEVEIFDPWQAQHVLATGSTWYQKYWYSVGNVGKWKNCFLGVHTRESDPGDLSPPKYNTAHAQSIQSHSTNLSEPMVIAIRNLLAKITIQYPRYAPLVHLRPLEPLLVNPGNDAYNLVPLVEADTENAKGAIILNPQTGDFEAISIFGKPFRYLNRNDVLKKKLLNRIDNMELIFTPSKQARSPFHPVYRVIKQGNIESFMDQNGNETTELHPLVPGS